MGFRKKLKKKILDISIKYDIFFTSKKVSDKHVFKLLNLIHPKKLNINHIRIGGKNDGGYVVPNDLNGINFCFSPGVGKISNFENELSLRKIKSFLADYSVDYDLKDHPMIDFEKKFLGPITYKNYINLKDWITSKINYEDNSDLILQMDIEGDEYDILRSMDLITLKKFRIILIEFHNLHYIFDEFYYKKIYKIFEILSEYFYCSHIHPNNDVDFIVKSKKITIPSVMEFSFIRKDRAKIISNNLEFPIELDQPNNPNKKDVQLPDCWFK
jgi:hypothetical protein